MTPDDATRRYQAQPDDASRRYQAQPDDASRRYQAQPDDATRPYPANWSQQPQANWSQQPPAYAPSPVRRRRKKWPLVSSIIVVVILVLLVVSDRVANAVAENTMASQFQSSMALSGKPNVAIAGFPFWTQLIGRDFHTVNISASNETTGPLTIQSLNGTLHGMHFQSLSSKSATIDQVNASALITLSALGKAGGIPGDITLSAAGQNEIKASVDVLGFSDSATAQVTQSGPASIHVHVIDAGGIPTDVLGSFADFTVSIPKMPAGVRIQNVTVDQQGLSVSIAGQNVTLSQ